MLLHLQRLRQSEKNSQSISVAIHMYSKWVDGEVGKLIGRHWGATQPKIQHLIPEDVNPEFIHIIMRCPEGTITY